MPDHAPDAVHVVAFVVDQVRVDELPEFMFVGDAEILTVAKGGAVTTIVADLEIGVAFAPLHVSVYVEFAVGLTDTEPDVPFVPDHAPLAVQVVALVVDQVSVDELPETIVAGEVEILTVAGGGVETLIVVD